MKPVFAALALVFSSMLPLIAGEKNENLSLTKGDAAPLFMAFRLEDVMAGDMDMAKAVKMSGSFGKAPVVLSFFTKECVVCPAEIAMLHDLAKTYAAKGVQFYLVLVKTSAFPENEIWKDVAARKYTLPVLWHRFPEAVFKKYITGKDGTTLPVPLLYVIDREGKIAQGGVGFDAKNGAAVKEALGKRLEKLVAGE